MKRSYAWIPALAIFLSAASCAWCLQKPKQKQQPVPAEQAAPAAEQKPAAAEKPSAPEVTVGQDEGEFEEGGQAPGQKPAEESGKPAGQEAKKGQPTTAPAPEGKGLFGSSNFIWIMLAALVLMFVFSSRSRKKQESKRKQMLQGLQKGDRVVTIGGVVGMVVEAREDEIVLKVDDNTRMKFARWAVRTVGEEVQKDKQKDTQEEK